MDDGDKILYLCDRTDPNCRKTNCSPEYCSHTSDIRHAVNFEKVEGVAYMETNRCLPEKEVTQSHIDLS